MKWAALAIMLMAIYPLSLWLRRNPSKALWAWVLLGLMPFLITVAHLVMAAILVDNPNIYHTQGVEFSALDALVIALYFGSRQERYRLPFRIEMILYFTAVACSAFQSFSPRISLYYSWQLLRMFLIYVVVARACVDLRVVKAILLGMAIGLCFQAPVSLGERFGLGMVQAIGTFDHQNILGVVSHCVVFPFFAAFLEGFWGFLPALVIVSGLAVQILTGSRGTIGLAAIGYVETFLVLAFGRFSPRKLSILGVAIVGLFVFVPVAVSSIEHRGTAEIVGSDEARGSLERAASMMLEDHPWGVGANTYIQSANMGGYNSAAHVDFESWAVFVHNSYWLVAVETGYFGLITFVLMLLRPTFVAFVSGFQNRKDQRGQLLLGLGVALFTVQVHGLFEWILMKSIPQYMLAIEFGMVAGLARQLGYRQRQYTPNTRIAMSSKRLIRTPLLTKH